ncbi:MAG: hypothetical protein BIFFINMI_03428 [Phycisphaerae bacterium]|nr:hypothetical protein [Phycisphaerae bacterium]
MPAKLKTAWVGVLGSPKLWRRSPRSLYIEELFAQAGLLNWRRVARARDFDPAVHGVAVIPDAGVLSADDAEALDAYVAAGGRLLALGRPGTLGPLFNVREGRAVAEGWLAPASRAFARELAVPLHVFDATALAGPADSPITLQQREAKAAPVAVSSRIRRGRGSALLIAAEIVGSVVHIQQGIAVVRDGTPPADGSAPIDEGILKCDDAIMLDWDRDRQTVVEGLCPIFAAPQGDLLRELLMSAIASLARPAGAPLVTLDPWPDNLPAVGLISHDSDLHDPAGVDRQIATDAEAGVSACWCTMAGTDDGKVSEYPIEQLARIAAAGHELAFHYDVQTDDPRYRWGRESFDRQLARLRERMKSAGIRARLVSNKNHYTRWEGRLDFFRWLEGEGFLVDQSRGPSKRGNLGWPFGTCHPWRPIDDEADSPRLMNLLEVSFDTQDLGYRVCPAEFGRVYVERAVARGGVVHLLFHPAHTHDESVRRNLPEHVALGRRLGVAWWTCEQIARWQFARRAATLESLAISRGVAKLRIKARKPLPGATIRVGRLRCRPADLKGDATVVVKLKT